ncbi:hypothetical protein LAZ67_2006053 [Cordylochernes scorpioides]|uniref:PiggyBac transposable element-derived protein domain-containing protein n=1 Tax=Cordylochernes scorpioides TaxID=51811 RepID=A0ABY6K559_9ARAC|nr:hypothetical protein LAZ67_2006053 [Cordylochernes scorpioides]
MNFLMKKWIKTSQVLGKLAWKDTTLDEMMAFIGVIFNMGNVKKNQIRDYWSKNELLETPWFGKVMSRGRFELLYSCFSLIDDSNLVPSSHPDYNPTARFEKLIEHVNNKFIYYYKPTQNLTVYESLVCLKNRTRLRQYMPQKHHGRFGVKLWMLCESKTGYCLRIKPYKGKLSPIIKSLSYDVPMNLFQESSLLGKGYHLITDNFFTSINLAKDLLDSHTFLTGTIRTNRKGLPKTLTSAKLGVDESLYMVNNNLLALAYKEKKSKPPVKFLSTFCDASSGKKVSDQRDYPQMKICYDSYMGGVDLIDQMLYTYMDERKGRKFYRKVILNIFHRALLNSFILYEQHIKDNPKLSRRAFNYSVINELVKNHLKPPVLPSTSQEVLEKLPEKREKGREDVNDEERAGRPSTSTTDEKINEVDKMILANRRITVREVAEDLNILIGSCHSIFINDLGMRQVAAKFVPKLLNCDQKQHRMNIANEMLDSVRDDPNLLQRVITGDEAWVYGYDVETKAQLSQWKLPHEPRPKKARQVRSNVKVLLTVLVHHEFLPQGRTVNKEYYLQVMRNLREAIRQKRPDLWKNKNWLLHHDNAPAHTSLLVRDFLAKNNTLMMLQPPYSPDLAPCNFFLFPKLKRPMKGRRYATLDEIKTASKEELKKILKNDFLKCFEDWKNRWHKCIIYHGDYFEGDKIGIHE